MARDPKPKKRYLDFYVKCWRLLSMGSRGDTNPVRYWFVLIVMVATNTVFIATMCKHIIIHATDIDGIAEIVDFATLFTAGLYRLIHAYFNGRKYEELVSYVHDNFRHESIADGPKLTMDKYVKRSKILSYSYIGLTMFWIMQITGTRVFYRLLTQTSVRPIVAIAVDMPFDECTQIGRALTYAIHLTSYYTTGLIYCFGDAHWFVILMLTTAQFELISHSLKSLALDDERGEETDCSYVERIVTSCLNQHQILRRCIRMMENLLNSIVLVDFLHAVTSITFILFDMTIAINQQSAVRMVNLVGFFGLSVAHMWILDYFGNELTLKEQDISRAIYQVPWYKYPRKVQKEVILMILLSSHPYKLTGGKLFSLSLEFFGKSMRTIFSYFTVLLQLREA